MSDRISFVQSDVCDSGLPSASADFVWGEDAWCYVIDKRRLVEEAARIVRPGDTIAFTDWIAGSVDMGRDEAERFLRFMKFPHILDLDGYTQGLEAVGCRVEVSEDTGRFAPYTDLYLNMLTMRLTYDALKKIGFDTDLMQALGAEMSFIQQLAHEGKVAQGRFVARLP